MYNKNFSHIEAWPVVIDYANNPRASTGNFECIYKQPMTLPKYGNAAELAVRGYLLPNDYFYRGHIEIKESYDDTDIGTEHDLCAVLNKLKRMYDTDTIMKRPEIECKPSRKESDRSYTHDTLSENEMSPTPDGVSEQSYENIYDISNDSASRSELRNRNVKCSSSHSQFAIETVCSVTDLISLFNRCTEVKQTFSFSKLDDGPQGKASYCSVSPKNISHYKNSNFKEERDNNLIASKQFNTPESWSSKEDSMFAAASNIISFIKKKEKEYSLNMK